MRSGNESGGCAFDRIGRRDVIKAGGTVLAIAALPAGAVAGRLGVGGLVADRRFPLSRATRAPAGAWRHEIDGDVTALWMDRLDALWRQAGPALAGITGEDALFVLEHLAWDRQRRVVLRKAIPAAGGPVPLVQWLIAPRRATA